jgi:hypothetical protein
MITAIRPSERSAPPPASPGDRARRFRAGVRAVRPAPRPAAPSASAAPPASGYVVDPEAVAAALLERLRAGRALQVRST